ncbi:antirestriction protein ArdA [uncultured Tateyamaria sp.]|uniref:antirestriction protein ArdA n=1 Tax=uncultured Tateyamaria sp. TaxID=455651 RepID=UPI002636C31F|nr:antirestriction protein ArdA [uncultured Tateyamaria sp.]
MRLAQAIGINQANLKQFLEAVDAWDENDKTRVILAVGECGYQFNEGTQPSEFDVDIYRLDTMRDLAEQFVEDGLFGDIPAPLAYYIDYDAIARDLSMDYAEATVAGHPLIYCCG